MSLLSLITITLQSHLADSTALPIPECLGSAFIHHLDDGEFDEVSHMQVIDGIGLPLVLYEGSVTGTHSTLGIRAIGFDAYSRYLYTLYAENPADSNPQIGRIGYDATDPTNFSIEYSPVTKLGDRGNPLAGADVFCPSGVNATEPGYFLAASPGFGYAVIRLNEEFNEEHIMVEMVNKGPAVVSEYDIAFHPDSNDLTNAIFYSVMKDEGIAYHLIRYVANFETFEVSGYDLGPLAIDRVIRPSSKIEGLYFDDFGNLSAISSEPGNIYRAHIPIDTQNTDNIEVQYVSAIATNWTADAARCIGFSPDDLPEFPPKIATLDPSELTSGLNNDLVCVCAAECRDLKPCDCDCFVPFANDIHVDIGEGPFLMPFTE